jgi:hypothetical protein
MFWLFLLQLFPLGFSLGPVISLREVKLRKDPCVYFYSSLLEQLHFLIAIQWAVSCPLTDIHPLL